MLRQEINLFKPLAAAPPPKTFLSTKLFVFCNAVIVGMFVLIYIFSSLNVYHLRSQKNKLVAQADELQKKFYDIKKKYPPIFFSENVTESINQLKQKLESRAKILDTLSKNIPFSKHLIALSKIIVPNVWLTDISITSNGNEITLKGKSIRMDNLQAFLGNVLRDKLFAEYALNVKNIENSSKTDANGILNFEITIAKKT